MQTKHLISIKGVLWQAGRGGDKQHSVKARFNKYNVRNDTFTLYDSCPNKHTEALHVKIGQCR